MNATSRPGLANASPPSMVMTVPVIAGEPAISRTAAAISSGVQPRPSGLMRCAASNSLLRLVAAGQRDARRDAVDADARRQRQRQHAGGAERGELRDAVGEVVGIGREHPVVEDVHDRAGALGRQQCCEALGDDDRRHGVDREVVRAALAAWRSPHVVGEARGVVDEQFEARRDVECALDEAGGCAGSARSAASRTAEPPPPRYRAASGIRRLRRAMVVQHDVPAVGREIARDGSADAPRRAGDQCCLHA